MIYGNKARNISESSYDAATSKVLKEIRELDEEVSKAADEMEFLQSYNEAGMLYMTEGEMGDKAKGLMRKIFDKTKQMFSKAVDNSKEMIDTTTDKIKKSTTKDFFDKYLSKFYMRTKNGANYSTKYPNILKKGADFQNKLTDMINDISSVRAKCCSDLDSIFSANENDTEKGKDCIDDAKKSIDKIFDLFKSNLDDATKETDSEQEIKISYNDQIGGNIVAEVNPDSFGWDKFKRILDDDEKWNKKSLDETESKIKKYESEQDDNSPFRTELLNVLRTHYDICSYEYKKEVEMDRMLISYMQKRHSEARKAFVSIATKGKVEAGEEE